MISAELPENEIARLDVLDSYQIMDTLPEQAYDDITLLASRICETPIALISLIDQERQWFKSRVGLSASETPRNLAFCAHAILTPKVFLVPDTLEDDRFRDNPLVTSDPSIRFYAGAPLITPNGYSLGTVCAIDTKPRKLSEDQIQALQCLGRQVVTQLELARSVRQLASLQEKTMRQSQELKRSNDLLTQFTNVVAHDLKAPLRSINGMLDILQAKYMDALDEKAEDYMRRAINAAKRMHSLIDHLLDYSMVGGAVDPDVRCDSADALKDAVANLQADIDERGAVITAGQLPIVHMGQSNLMQVFQNLLANSIKFTASDTPSRIQVQAEAQDDFIEFTIHDNGMGVAPDQLDNVFELFTRLHSKDSIPGSGIGLATTKKIINSHLGRIWMESAEGQGSTVHFTVPVQ